MSGGRGEDTILTHKFIRTFPEMEIHPSGTICEGSTSSSPLKNDTVLFQFAQIFFVFFFFFLLCSLLAYECVSDIRR